MNFQNTLTKESVSRGKATSMWIVHITRKVSMTPCLFISDLQLLTLTWGLNLGFDIVLWITLLNFGRITSAIVCSKLTTVSRSWWIVCNWNFSCAFLLYLSSFIVGINPFILSIWLLCSFWRLSSLFARAFVVSLHHIWSPLHLSHWFFTRSLMTELQHSPHLINYRNCFFLFLYLKPHFSSPKMIKKKTFSFTFSKERL